MERKKIMENISHNLKGYRTVNKVTQDEVAKGIGCTRSAVGSWEEQRALPPVDVLIRLAMYFKSNIILFTESKIPY